MKAAFKDFVVKMDYPDVLATIRANEEKTKIEVAEFLSELGKDRVIDVSRHGITFTIFYWNQSSIQDLVKEFKRETRRVVSTPPAFIPPQTPPLGTLMCQMN